MTIQCYGNILKVYRIKCFSGPSPALNMGETFISLLARTPRAKVTIHFVMWNPAIITVEGESTKSNAGTTGVTQLFPGPMRMYGHSTYWSKIVLGHVNSPIYPGCTSTWAPVRFEWAISTHTMEAEKLLNRKWKLWELKDCQVTPVRGYMKHWLGYLLRLRRLAIMHARQQF